MNRTPLFNSLKRYSSLSRGYFRIPGHRFERGIPEAFRDFAGDEIFKLDITETPLSDDLHNPKTVIAESQRYTAEAFGADKSFYLVNGTSCGNQSMIIASAGEGDKILLPRNAHKSVMAGLIISGAEPVYMPAPYIDEIGITGTPAPEAAELLLEQNPGCKAVFAVSPSYHGFCGDITSLAATAHSRGIPLLVDEAHGAHFYFCDSLPQGAITSGADAAAQSLHKVAGALTQSSLLHLKTDLIDEMRIDSALRMTMSTSPSYILLTSLELARDSLEKNGNAQWERTIGLAERIKSEIRKLDGFSCPEKQILSASGIFDSDPTRIIINCDTSEISGWDLKEQLWNGYNIDVEMADSRNILLLLNPGNTETEAENLISAMRSISRTGSSENRKGISSSAEFKKSPDIPRMILTPRQAYYSKTRTIAWKEMVGKVAAEPAVPYPPGIPVLYPGELITEDIFEFLDDIKNKNRHLHGIGDKSLKSIRVCDI